MGDLIQSRRERAVKRLAEEYGESAGSVALPPEEWDKLLYPDSMIWDPDGWRGSKDGRPWTDPITKDEFEARRVWCTIGRRLPCPI